MRSQPLEPEAPQDTAPAGELPGALDMPVPVRWMPALFRHTRVDARQYRHEVQVQACAMRLAAHGGDPEAWLTALPNAPAEAWALASALEAACWQLPELVDLDVSAAVAAWRQGRPRGPAAPHGGADDGAARVWLPACPDSALALRLNAWLAAVQPALPWLVTRAPDPAGSVATAPPDDAADIAWRTHRVLHEPMAGRFELIIAPALLAGVQPHVQRRLLAQWARLLGEGSAAGGQPDGEPGLLWVGGGAACEQALRQGWQRVGPGPLLRPPRAVGRPVAVPAHAQAATPAGGAKATLTAAAPLPARPAQPPGGDTTGLASPAGAGLATPTVMKTEALLLALAREALVLRFEPQRSLDARQTGQRVAMAAVLSLPDADRHQPETALAWQAARHPAHAALLSQWALQLACREGGRWTRAGTGAAPDLVVPVVATQLQQQGWADQLCRTLEHAGLPPERLTLSLGARSLLQPPAALLRALVEVRRLGVRISVARLKAGDALLDRLPQLPIDELKIDARLLAGVPGDPLAEATVRRIAALGRAHGWRVVADGVAREAQRRWLAALHCHAYQGPLAGAPLAAGPSGEAAQAG